MLKVSTWNHNGLFMNLLEVSTRKLFMFFYYKTIKGFVSRTVWENCLRFNFETFTTFSVFKSGPSKICGRQPLKNLKVYGLLMHLVISIWCLPNILASNMHTSVCFFLLEISRFPYLQRSMSFLKADGTLNFPAIYISTTIYMIVRVDIIWYFS